MQSALSNSSRRERQPGARDGTTLLRASGILQVARLCACAALCAWDWIAVEIGGALAGEPADRRRALLAARLSQRLVDTLGALKGVWAKLGQFAAMRLDVLPPTVTLALGSLRDRVPPLPLEAIRGVIEAELGVCLEHAFPEFDPTPLGAASIAQVHRARLAGGEDVAVKVQYPWLRASTRADLRLLGALFRLWARVTGRTQGDARRLFDEFAAGLNEELDFAREADVAREIAANMADDARVVVPDVFPALSTSRVLTLRYHDAVGITDRAGLARLGVDPGDVLDVLARAYATQIFVDGLFHADPHPGNLFVLAEPDAARAPRLLFIDFGLSRRLDPTLRRELRQGVYALMQRDLDAFLAGMDRMGMIAPGSHDGVREAVRGMFERIEAQGGALALGGGQVLSLKDEAKALLWETRGLQLPSDLLLYAKTLSYVFALGEELDPEADMMKRSLPYLLQFLAQKE